MVRKSPFAAIFVAMLCAPAMFAVGCATPDKPFNGTVDGGPAGDGGGGPDAGDAGGGTDLAGTMTNCTMGFADCDGSKANGCETNLNTPSNCGACGKPCVQIGGTNACALFGASYICKPTCDATHADCDGIGDNGCEADLTTVLHCGACNKKCVNPNGTTLCSTQGAGYFCVPTCTTGYAACGDPGQGCTTPTTTDVSNCGACGRSCSSSNVATRACVAGACRPVCNAPYANCSSPSVDNGCETNGTLDSGENDNSCGATQSFSTGEGSTTNRTNSRILPANDTDTFTVNLVEGSRVCVPFTGQSYNAKITLTSPEALVSLSYNLNSCDNTWSSIGNTICVNWGGTCSLTDDITVYFQVKGVGASNSCQNYNLTVQYCNEGTKCPGC